MFIEDQFSDDYLEHLDAQAETITNVHAFEHKGELYLVDYVMIWSTYLNKKTPVPIAVFTLDEKENAVEMIPMPDALVEAAIGVVKREALCLS